MTQLVMATSNLFVLLSCILMCLSLTTTAQFCYDTGNFTTNSTYGKIRNQILSSLASNVTANGGFYTANLTQDSDTVYALALCRADLLNESCSNCVSSTSEAIINSCPNQIEATDYGRPAQCIVRYSNWSFFEVVSRYPAMYYWNDNNITNYIVEFDQALNSLVDGLILRAATGSRLKFATGEKKYATYETIYGLMQCVPDLSLGNCGDCLKGAVDEYNRCCMRRKSATVMRPSCIFQYDLYRFFESPVGDVPPPPTPPSPVTNDPPPPPSTNATTKAADDKSSTFRTTIIVVVSMGFLLVLTALSCAYIRLRRRKEARSCDTSESQSVDSLRFDFATIRAATNDFSNANELGHGGFGSVYKGKLANGEEIAVKRLAGCSEQGEAEFQNEIVLMARLQHKNLVRLLGFCLEGKERLLIYEFVPNASLDRFIFDPIKRQLLNWETRYKIIEGIARGLLYLHQDSQLRIIHHDLKAGNVLLDGEMTPKIADFGMARLSVVDQSKGVTRRIAGTFGYMPPEYAKYGRFSVKTDIFSFGVLILEIVSGKRNGGNGGPEHVEHLISYAWKEWRRGKASRLIDQTLVGGSKSEKMRCIHIGLLCVQENVAKRPTTASVVLMLNSFSSMSLPSPSEPAFLVQSRRIEPNTATEKISVNEASITEPCPR